MRTISDFVENWIEQNPVVREHLAAGIINHSALARDIKADIEQSAGEKVSIEAVTIALNRIGKRLKPNAGTPNPLSFIGDISIQTGLDILIYEVSDFDSLDIPPRSRSEHTYFVSAKGIWHASIITTSDAARDPRLCQKAHTHERDLTATTVRLKPGHIPVPGVCAGILSLLANKGVNLEEVNSTHNELTILTDQSNADLALKTLLDAKI